MVKCRQTLLILSMVCLGLLSGCGGGGGSTPTTPTTPTTPSLVAPTPLQSTNSVNVYGKSTAQSGESIGFSVTAAINRRIDEITWQQTAGPNLIFLAPYSQAIGFDVVEAGNYQLQVSGRMDNGTAFQQVIDFSVVQSSETVANIRADHSVSEQGNVSLRIDSTNAAAETAWNWRQVSGTVSVSLTPQENTVFFDAPTVSKDEIVVLEGSVTMNDGSVQTDQARIVIKNVEIDQDGYFPRFNEQVVTTDMQPARADSPYADALLSCVYDNLVNQSCTFGKLPLLGKTISTPTIDDVMDRVLVSHPWMATRFEQFLQDSSTGPDMLKLLRATTAVVISYDIRPSFYWTASGAIYLDAANFWMTPQERDTLNTAPDFRSDFGNDLQFLIPWRYIKDNDYYVRNGDYPRASRLTKRFADLEANISWLMYHELAHANDFFPPTAWSQLSNTDSPLAYANRNPSNSEAFSVAYPLDSQEMRDLGNVSFAGESASAAQRGYVASDVVNFFEPDFAPAYYSYSTIREDYATLFERFMMVYRLNATADTAIVDSDEARTYPVAWGQRNRVNATKIQPRTAYVVEQILPDLDAASIQATLPGVQQFEPGVGYFEQVSLSPIVAAKNKATQTREIFNDVMHHHHGRPKTPEK